MVNSAIVAYFIEDLRINRHFDLFKKLLFMEDGEFSLSLSNQLFEKVSPFSRTQNYSEKQSTKDILIRRPEPPFLVDVLDE